MCIKMADGSAPVLGTTLDLVASFMNHSCNPAAFVFFEGRQMRVRALRSLRAGEEITQTYVDLSGSVFSRQATTKAEYFFQCNCVRCEDELADLQQKERGGLDLMQLRSAQERLLDLANHAGHPYNSTDVYQELSALEADVRAIIRDAFVSGVWPPGMSPMPLVLKTFSQICKAKGDSAGALRYSLEATLSLRDRKGSLWAHMLFDAVQNLSFLIQSNAYDISGEDGGLSEDVCWNVLHAYLGELKQAATQVYGPDSAYTQSIVDWYSRAVNAAQPPRPGTRRFVRVYNASQATMLRWAGIEESRGISISTPGHV
ncbi:hypothetical protein BJX96DRAFT_135820 [Aspergillus floccosus]